MTKSYSIHAWCVRPFITYLDPVEAETPEEAIAIARKQPEKLLDNAEECNGWYPWDEFAVYDEDGKELLHVREAEAIRQESTLHLYETLVYVAQMLSNSRPNFLRKIGLHGVLEQVEKALTIADNTNPPVADTSVEEDQD